MSDRCFGGHSRREPLHFPLLDGGFIPLQVNQSGFYYPFEQGRLRQISWSSPGLLLGKLQYATVLQNSSRKESRRVTLVRKCVQAGEEALATKCDERTSERMRGMRKKKKIGARAASQKAELHFGSDRGGQYQERGHRTVGEC